MMLWIGWALLVRQMPQQDGIINDIVPGLFESAVAFVICARAKHEILPGVPVKASTS